MDYLTKYYKNLCEQYQEQLDNLKRRAANLKAGELWGKEVPEDILKQYQNDPKNWTSSSDDIYTPYDFDKNPKKVSGSINPPSSYRPKVGPAIPLPKIGPITPDNRISTNPKDIENWDADVADRYKDVDPEIKIKELEQEKQRRTPVQRKIIDAEIQSLRRLIAMRSKK